MTKKSMNMERWHPYFIFISINKNYFKICLVSYLVLVNSNNTDTYPKKKV